jgi:hypothetical protein
MAGRSFRNANQLLIVGGAISLARTLGERRLSARVRTCRPMSTPASKRRKPQKPSRRSRAVKEARQPKNVGGELLAWGPQTELPPFELRIEQG